MINCRYLSLDYGSHASVVRLQPHRPHGEGARTQVAGSMHCKLYLGHSTIRTLSGPLARWLGAGALLVLSLTGGPAPTRAADSAPSRDPVFVLQSYLRAIYARDFAAAYRSISTADQRVRDLNRYIRQRGPFHGFALQIAKRLSEAIQLTIAQREAGPDRIRMVVDYRVPDARQLAPLLLNWDVRRLNSLAAHERRQMLEEVEKKIADNAIDVSEGQETFELVREGGAWRVFLDWAAGVKVTLRLDIARAADLDVVLSKNQFVLQPGELFEIALKINNRAGEAVTARIGHIVEPNAIADFLDFVQCGFLQPVTIPAAIEQEFTGTYLLRGSLPEGIRQLNLTYDFRLLK